LVKKIIQRETKKNTKITRFDKLKILLLPLTRN